MITTRDIILIEVHNRILRRCHCPQQMTEGHEVNMMTIQFLPNPNKRLPPCHNIPRTLKSQVNFVTILINKDAATFTSECLLEGNVVSATRVTNCHGTRMWPGLFFLGTSSIFFPHITWCLLLFQMEIFFSFVHVYKPVFFYSSHGRISKHSFVKVSTE